MDLAAKSKVPAQCILATIVKITARSDRVRISGDARKRYRKLDLRDARKSTVWWNSDHPRAIENTSPGVPSKKGGESEVQGTGAVKLGTSYRRSGSRHSGARSPGLGL